jgi:hypothetical protein
MCVCASSSSSIDDVLAVARCAVKSLQQQQQSVQNTINADASIKDSTTVSTRVILVVLPAVNS